MLARTHACIYTHVGRDDRLDGGLREEGGGSITSADGGHSEGRCPRRAGQRGVKCVLGGGLGRWRGPNRPVVKLCSPYPRLLSFLMLGVDSGFYDKELTKQMGQLW